MTGSKRVLMLVHPQFVPTRKGARGTELDVWRALRRLGHSVEVCALDSSLDPLAKSLVSFRPQIAFNLLEEFRGEGVFDFHAITYLEAQGVAFTGCNPRALVVTRNKLWAGGIAEGSGCVTPKSTLLKGPTADHIDYPLFIKFNREHASLGITKDNVVNNPKQLRQVTQRMRQLHSGELLAQQFIAGREVSVSVLGNRARPQAFHPWVLHLPNARDVATERVKFSSQHRLKRGIRARRFLSDAVGRQLRKQAQELFRSFDLSGYARFDFRIDAEQRAYLIDVNANPNLARSEDFAMSAKHAGLRYEDVIQKLLQLGLSYSPSL